MNLDVAVCLPREAATIGLVRGVVSHALAVLGVEAGCVDDIRLALSEACTNVVEHAAADDEYEVRLRVQGLRCELSVENTGSGFDAAALEHSMPDQSSARGRGVAIMGAVMDHVDLRSEPKRGTIVHLVKTLTVAPGSPLGPPGLHAIGSAGSGALNA